MGTEKFYAVRKGKIPGIYRTWDDCRAQVHGVKGAEYKKFDSRPAAEAFLQAVESLAPVEAQLREDEMMAYVDGSYNVRRRLVGYGVVTLSKEGREDFYGSNPHDVSAHRNVAGEVFAAMKAMQIAQARGKKTLYLFYDYAGIRHWALGEWKANLPLTQEYRDFARQVQKNLTIEFFKVEAHTGDYYNEEADRLAKQGAQMSIS